MRRTERGVIGMTHKSFFDLTLKHQPFRVLCVSKCVFVVVVLHSSGAYPTGAFVQHILLLRGRRSLSLDSLDRSPIIQREEMRYGRSEELCILK